MILSTIFSNVILVNDYTEQEEWGVVLIRERPPCESGVRLRNAMKIFFQKTTNTHGVVNSLVAVLVVCSSSIRSDESKDFFISFKECLYVVVSY